MTEPLEFGSVSVSSDPVASEPDVGEAGEDDAGTGGSPGSITSNLWN